MKTVNINLGNPSVLTVLSLTAAHKADTCLKVFANSNFCFSIAFPWNQTRFQTTQQCWYFMFFLSVSALSLFSLVQTIYNLQHWQAAVQKLLCGRIVEYKNLYSHYGWLQPLFEPALTLPVLKETHKSLFALCSLCQ